MKYTIAALFIDHDSIYKSFEFIDCYDENRDARKYSGTIPVIAHPPCQRWGKMAKANYARWGGEHNRLGNDGGCFFSALANVRLYGGVLEHPAQSYAWEHFGLAKPKRNCWYRSPGDYGWVCEIWQSAYGHKANKATWLYYVGKVTPPELNWNRPTGGYQVGYPDRRGKINNKPTLSKREANATPGPFALEMIKLVTLSKGENNE